MKIIKPLNDGHAGDTFRELVDLWSENGYCDVYYENIQNVWIDGHSKVLLYDRPTLEWLGSSKYDFALFGNTIPKLPKSSEWIFWGRRPRVMEKIKNNRKSWVERNIESVFLGKIENNVQLKKRTESDWSDNIKLFEMPIMGEYKYTQEEYLRILTDSKFGLCLSGYGPKCNREIELLCMGVIPLITPLVDLTYYNKLEENIHYIKINNPDEIPLKIKSLSEDQCIEMSQNCINWYEKNCSVEGSYKTTLEILEKNKIKI